MNIRPIRTESDYSAALDDIEQYFDKEPKPGTPAADRFDVLATLVSAYESQHWSIEAPDAVSAITEVMALRGFTQTDLGRLLGSRSRASEIMNRRRPITMEQARRLHEEWGVPAASFLTAEARPKPVRRRYKSPRGGSSRIIEEVPPDHVPADYELVISADNLRRAPAAPVKPRGRREPQRAVAVSDQVEVRAKTRSQRNSNSQMIEEILRAIAPRTARPSEIRRVLQRDKGVSMAFTTIRKALGQLKGRDRIPAAAEPGGASERRRRLR